MKALPYYKFYWQDFRASRTVQRMGYIAQGLYRSLLDECWAEGSIPTDPGELAEICGCPEQVLAEAWQMLSKCFVLENGRYINLRLDEERTEKDKIRATKAVAGKAGGLSRSNVVSEGIVYASGCLADASGCHIEEKTREENSKEEKNIKDIQPVEKVKKTKSISPTTEIPPHLVASLETIVSRWPHKTVYEKPTPHNFNNRISRARDLWDRMIKFSPGEDFDLMVRVAIAYLDQLDAGKTPDGLTHYAKALTNFFGKEASWKEKIALVLDPSPTQPKYILVSTNPEINQDPTE